MPVSSFLTRLSNLVNIGRNKEAAFVNEFNKAFLSWIGGGFTSYDDNGINYIEKGYGLNPDVYAVVTQQAQKIAEVPYYFRRINDKNKAFELKQLNRITKGNYTPDQLAKKRILESKAYSQDEMKMPLDKPNVNHTWSEFMQLIEINLQTTGNAYLYMLRPKEGVNAGQPIEVYVLPSYKVQIVTRNVIDWNSTLNPVIGYTLIDGSRYAEFDAEDVIHIKLANPFFDFNGSHLYGLSPLKSALRNIQSSNEAINNNIRTMRNGGAFGFIHAKNQPLTAEQAQEIKNRMVEMRQDNQDLSQIAGVSSELAFTQVSLTTDELKPFDFLKYDQKTICNVLGWSDKLLNNDDGGKYDNVKQFRQQVITGHVYPRLCLIDDALNRYFFPLFKEFKNYEIYHDVSELPEMQTDMGIMVGWMKELLDRGVINRDEFRASLKYDPIETEEMMAYTTSQNLTTLSEAMMPTEVFDMANMIEDEGEV